MTNKPSSREHPAALLSEAGYVERERWAIERVLQFVRRELRGHGLVAKLALYGYGAAAIGVVAVGIWQISQGRQWFYDILLPFGAGCLAMLVLIVPHELIHGLMYRLVGAPKVAYGYDLRRLVFHASAPYHVLGRYGLYLVALAPFVVLSTGLLVCFALVEDPWYRWAIAGALLMHTQGCMGDFAMVNFWHRQARPDDWVTYDDTATREFVLLSKAQTSWT